MMGQTMAVDLDPYRLSSPRIFLVRMIVFLILAGFVALILYRQIKTAFSANPGLNGLIIGVLFIGIIHMFRQVVRLFPEIRWVNGLKRSPGDGRHLEAPTLLAPMATMLGSASGRGISTTMLRAILDSTATRLDEAREIARYMTGLLIFLGLLGTFWGLLETVGSIGNVIKSMQTGGDATVMFDDLKRGLQEPIVGISISFTASLFGLAGSLILGFLDLQAGQAQNRFYNELEDYLSATASDGAAEAAETRIPADLREALQRLSGGADPAQSRNATTAMANLAEGIQGLVQHMRQEQQMIRDWVEAQAAQQQDIRKLLERLAAEHAKN
jgi:membrane associated rhomboid family serine protease